MSSVKHDNVIEHIINKSLTFVAFMTLPLNIIIYSALIRSDYQSPRYIPPLMSIMLIAIAVFKKRIGFHLKTGGFIILLFLAGCFNLLLGLIDLASLWFILAIIFTLIVFDSNKALIVFATSFGVILFVGYLMVTRNSFIPLNYHFDQCQYACVLVRILHFLLIGYLVYSILSEFISALKANMNELKIKAIDLGNLNLALIREMGEKKEIQKHLMDAVIQTEEKERQRLASDLHDGLGPVLSAINLYFQAYIDAPGNGSKDEIESKLKLAIDSAITDISKISHNISPQILQNFGLIVALNNFISQVNRSSTIKYKTEFAKLERFDLTKELAIYRMITELINNTIKHSGASDVCISISAESSELMVNYSDNGKGFDPKEIRNSSKGIGLINIDNRVLSLGGSISLNSFPSKGINVEIRMPYEAVKN